MQIINGALKNYAWGIPGGLAAWLPSAEATNVAGSAEAVPQAELWFGVHPSGASRIVDSELTLDQVLDRTDVPLLVKILAAAKPLSVQVHPDREFAQEGFNELNNTEEFAGAFADSYEKIEVFYALTPFTALCGWRPLDQVVRIFRALSLDLPVGFFIDTSDSRRVLFEYCVAHNVALHTLEAIPTAVRDVGLSQLEISAYQTVVADYPGDQGALLAVFLQPIALDPGESIYIPVGMPHCYISGTGIEVMTSSDNVLRLGLTPKLVYPELALRALDFESSLSPVADAPFSIEVFHAESQIPVHTLAPSGQFRLVLCLDGTTQILDTTLSPGQAAVVTAAEPAVSISTTGRCALVRSKS